MLNKTALRTIAAFIMLATGTPAVSLPAAVWMMLGTYVSLAGLSWKRGQACDALAVR